MVSTIDWPDSPSGPAVDVASVHLDFARPSVRQRQAEELVAFLAPRGRPLIVMGDFNCQITDEEPTLRNVIDELDLTAHDGTATAVTFPSSGRELDWILVSKDLELASYAVLPDVWSDHRFVRAEVRYRSEPQSSGAPAER